MEGPLAGLSWRRSRQLVTPEDLTRSHEATKIGGGGGGEAILIPNMSNSSFSSRRKTLHSSTFVPSWLRVRNHGGQTAREVPHEGTKARSHEDGKGQRRRIDHESLIHWLGIPSRSKHHQMAWAGGWHGCQRDVLVEGGEAAMVFHGEGEQIEVGDLP